MAATVARLKQLQEKVGDVGVDKLFRAHYGTRDAPNVWQKVDNRR